MPDRMRTYPAGRKSRGSTARRMASGYVRVWAPSHPTAGADGYALEHRMVAWDLGILADPGDHVHHRDGNKANNTPLNLEAKTPSEHHREHVAELGFVVNQYGTWPIGQPMVECVCPVDGVAFSIRQSEFAQRRQRSRTGLLACSRRCGRVLSTRVGAA